MKISFDPSLTVVRHVTVESLALSWWYDSQPEVRRLWGIKETHQLRVIVAIEPTHDNNDVYPVWCANYDSWTRELSRRTGLPVQLELVHEFVNSELEIDGDGDVIVDLFWRDASLNRFNEVL